VGLQNARPQSRGLKTALTTYYGLPAIHWHKIRTNNPLEPIGAEQTASGYDVAWKMAGADQY
jgi:hypothetical protein